MSHNIYYMTVDELENKNRVMNAIYERANREGDGYEPGQMHWHPEVPILEDRDAAEKWIEAHDKGWYDDHAVRYYSYSSATRTKKIDELQEKAKETQAKLGEYTRKHSVRTFKAEFVGCQSCGSKLARTFLRSELCPVCHTDLRSKTTLDTIEKYQSKIDSFWKQVEDEKKKQKSKRKVMWLIKYEFHS